MSGASPFPPFDLGLKAFTEFWGQAGKAALQAQETAGRAFADAMKAMPGGMLSGMPGGAAASQPWPMPGVDGGGSAAAATPFTPDAAELARAAQVVGELWTTAASLSGTLVQALANAGAGGAAGRPADPTVEATFRAMADPRTWLASAGGMDSVIGRVAEGPQLADLWNAERQQARLVQAWLDVRRRALEHNAVVLEAWLRAARAFSEGLASRTDGHAASDGKAMLSLWTETANRVLLETQRSEPFLRTQAAMIRAGTELKMAQRDLAERWANQFGLPTRTELDDVHRTLTELRREVRKLRQNAGRLSASDAMPSHGMAKRDAGEAARPAVDGKAKPPRGKARLAGKE